MAKVPRQAGAMLLAAWAAAGEQGNAPGQQTAGSECLRWHGRGGCADIRSKDLCLRSRDGLPWREWLGRGVAGQPCAWCGGGACSSAGDAVCAPAEMVEGRPNVTIASCEDAPASSSRTKLFEYAFAGTLPREFHPTDEGHRCVAASGAHETEDGDRLYFTFTAESLNMCQALCAAEAYCTAAGFEHRGNASVCHLWWYPVESAEPEPGRDCLRVVNATGELRLADVGQAAEVRAAPWVPRVVQGDGAAAASPADGAVVAVSDGAASQDGLTQQQKAVIGGSVAGGVAGAALLGGLLGGLLPAAGAANATTATVTTTQAATTVHAVLRGLADGVAAGAAPSRQAAADWQRRAIWGEWLGGILAVVILGVVAMVLTASARKGSAPRGLQLEDLRDSSSSDGGEPSARSERRSRPGTPLRWPSQRPYPHYFIERAQSPSSVCPPVARRQLSISSSLRSLHSERAAVLVRSALPEHAEEGSASPALP